MGRSQIQEGQGKDSDFLSEAEFTAAKSNSTPGKAAIGAPGVSTNVSRDDHIHPVNDHIDLTGITATDHHSNVNDPTALEKAALDAAALPSGSNPFVTMGDLSDTGATSIRLSSEEENGDKIKTTTFKVLKRFIFSGTAARGVPTDFKVLVNQDGTDTTESADVRIFDITNSLEIARIQAPSPIAQNSTIFSTAVFNNLPATEAVLQIEGKVSAAPLVVRLSDSLILF